MPAKPDLFVRFFFWTGLGGITALILINVWLDSETACGWPPCRLWDGSLVISTIITWREAKTRFVTILFTMRIGSGFNQMETVDGQPFDVGCHGGK